MLVEFAIGRRGRSDAANAIANVASDVGASRPWALVGLMGIVAAFTILSFYSVIGGWAIATRLKLGFAALPVWTPARRSCALMPSWLRR
jgi:NSS family neurotransmitter:Na+ symporter